MRADRLIAILMRLQDKGKMTAKELAGQLEVAERTIYRDIDALCAAGVPIVAESGLGGGFALPPDYRTKVDGLNKAEIQSLFLLMNEQPFKQLGFAPALKSAMLKWLNSLPERQREDAEWIRNRVYLDMEGWSHRKSGTRFLEAAQLAVWEQREARLGYVDRRQCEMELIVEPLGLVVKTGMWFVVARAEEGIYAFRLDRMRFFELTGRLFERPPAFRLEDFWLRWLEAFANKPLGYRVRLAAGKEALVRLVKGGGVVRESVSEPGIEELAESPAERSRAVREVEFENEEAAVRALLAESDSVVVEEPASLKDRIASEAARLLALYSFK